MNEASNFQKLLEGLPPGRVPDDAGIDPLHDIARDFEEVPLVLQRHNRPMCPMPIFVFCCPSSHRSIPAPFALSHSLRVR